MQILKFLLPYPDWGEFITLFRKGGEEAPYSTTRSHASAINCAPGIAG